MTFAEMEAHGYRFIIEHYRVIVRKEKLLFPSTGRRSYTLTPVFVDMWVLPRPLQEVSDLALREAQKHFVIERLEGKI